MRHSIFVFVIAIVLSACTANGPVDSPESPNMNDSKPKVELQFLTRDGCRNTPVMLENLRAAIAAGKVPAQYTVVPQGSLSLDDPRVGYPTPTILINGRDAFGLPVPQQPFPEPS